MHRSESEELIPCAACGAVVDRSTGRGYGFGSDTILCYDCAERRGGSYDALQDRWVEAPRIDDLARDGDISKEDLERALEQVHELRDFALGMNNPMAWAEFGRVACISLGGLPDDRSVEAVVDYHRRLARKFQHLTAPSAEVLARLGSRDAIECLVRSLRDYPTWRRLPSVREELPLESDRTWAHGVHELLVEAAARRGIETTPEWSERPHGAWDDWFDEHAEAFPESLGRIGEG